MKRISNGNIAVAVWEENGKFVAQASTASILLATTGPTASEVEAWAALALDLATRIEPAALRGQAERPNGVAHAFDGAYYTQALREGQMPPVGLTATQLGMCPKHSSQFVEECGLCAVDERP